MSAKILVLYYSSWGHMEAMANAAAEGVKSAGAKVDVKRVTETVPEDIQKAYHYKMDQKPQLQLLMNLQITMALFSQPQHAMA